MLRQSTWQSRLASKDNVISKKLLDNNILLTGYSSDVIYISEVLNAVNDPIKFNVDNIGVINMIFPPMKDIPLRRFIKTSGEYEYSQATNAKDEVEPFVVYAPIETIITQGSLVLRFFENPSSIEPLILPLSVAEIRGDFGARHLVLQKLNLVYSSTPIHPTIMEYLLQLAARRGLLKW